MKCMLLVAATILPLLSTHANAQANDPRGWIGTETVQTRCGSFQFKNGYPTGESTDKLYEFRTVNRAVESYLHCVTQMSMFYMQKGLNDFGLDAANKFLIFETLLHAPQGKEKNWVKTVPGKGWFPYLRFYSPTDAFFDKTWRPDDIVEIGGL